MGSATGKLSVTGGVGVEERSRCEGSGAVEERAAGAGTGGAGDGGGVRFVSIVGSNQAEYQASRSSKEKVEKREPHELEGGSA